MDNDILGQLLHRAPEVNKYTFGHVLILGGSPGMVGAPLLAGEAALRIGAGLVTIASSAAVTDKLDRRVKEIMTVALPQAPTEAAGVLSAFTQKRKVTAAIVGPGLNSVMDSTILAFLRDLRLPVVIDAGGLTAYSAHLFELKTMAAGNKKIVLTPHTGEYEKLSGSRLPADRNKIKGAVSEFAAEMGVVLVLKGHHTLVVRTDGSAYENDTGNPGLATAGTGDVLSGIIGGLMAQGIEAAQAAEAGVYVHGLAGDLAAQAKTQPGMIASDVLEFLPAALKSLM